MVGRKWMAMLSVLGGAAELAACGSSTPDLVAAPTPAPPAFCSFLWVVPEGNGAIDWYEVDVMGEAWSSGATALGANAAAFYILGYDPSTLQFASAGMTTSGQIELSTHGADVGAKAGLLDHGAKTFFDASGLLGGYAHELGPQVATGGAGDFEGVLSSSDHTEDVTNGLGIVHVRYDDGGVNATFGGEGNGVQYAYCER